jgi:hypothetical protein
MGVNVEREKNNAQSEIEAARKDLMAETRVREREAKERLDDLLSEKHMEFCSRCNRKIGSRIDWAGKCMEEGCGKLICRECWQVNNQRFCRDHSEIVPREREADIGKLSANLRALRDEHEETVKGKLDYFTAEYANWLVKRLERDGPIDWTPKEYMDKPKMKVEKKEGEVVITLSVKRWFWNSTKLSIVLSSFDSGAETDLDFLSSFLQKEAGKHKGYKLVVLVTESAKMEVVDFVNKFSGDGFSLFMDEPETANLYFNINDTIARGYSQWFSQKKEPHGFRENLRRIADLVSGKHVVSEKMVGNEFGFDKKVVPKILKSCEFLSYLKDTDTYMVKED